MLLSQPLVATAARLLVMSLLAFSQTSACGMKSVHQENHRKDVLPLKTRRLARELAGTASLVQQGSHVTFNATLAYESLGPYAKFPSVLSSDGTVLAIGFAPYRFIEQESNRVYVYHLLNPNTTKAKWVQTGYFTRASSNRLLQGTVALSGDGKVLAVGAKNASSGSVQVYRFQSNKWVPLGSVLLVANSYFPESFGTSLALSFNGSILAVQNDFDGTLDFCRWNGTVWRRRGTPINDVNSAFSMSQDGNVVAVITFFELISIYRFVASASGGWVPFGNDITFGNDGVPLAISLSGNGKRVAALAFPSYSDFLSGSKSVLRVFEFDTNRNDWISVGPGVTQTLVSDSYNDDPGVSLSNGGGIVAELRGAASEYCPGEVRVYQVTKNGTWPQIYKYEGPYIRSLTGISAALSGDGKTLAVADFGFETYRVFF